MAMGAGTMTVVQAAVAQEAVMHETDRDDAGRGDAAGELLRSARRGLRAATLVSDDRDRYLAAHAVALRTATAVLAVRAQPREVRRGPRGVWELLGQVAPELREWAAFFARAAGVRRDLEEGQGQVTQREADDLVRDAEAFQAHVQTVLCRDPLTCDPSSHDGHTRTNRPAP
jgi:hypothetical protein